MMVLHYRQGDTWFREIIERSQAALKELKLAYEARGHKAWLNLYDDEKWMLTVQEMEK